MSIVEVSDEGQVRVVTLNRPERHNATSAELVAEIHAALPLPEEHSIRAVVITGNGRSFSSGGDLKAKPVPIAPGSRRMREIFNPLIMRLTSLPMPIIAAVNGPALGAGLSLALAADVRVASSRAIFSSGFVDVGLATDTGSSYFLPRLVGYGRAFDILATGRRVESEEALAIGLVSSVVSPDELLDHARETAGLLAAKPGLAVSGLKELLQRSTESTLAEQLELEARMFDRASADPHRKAAKQAMVDRMSSTAKS